MITVNGIPVFDVNKLEKRIKSLERLHGHAIDFAVWYSGMDRKKVETAYKRYIKENKV